MTSKKALSLVLSLIFILAGFQAGIAQSINQGIDYRHQIGSSPFML